MSDERQPWDRLEGEPEAAYTKFMEYLNLGIGRSLARVTKGGKKRASGYIQGLSTKWNWTDRAMAWDRYKIVSHGEEITLMFISSLRTLTKNLLTRIENPRLSAKQAGSILEIIKVLSPYVSVDLIQKIAADSSTAGPRPMSDAG